jgi:hypothetical protein
MSRRDISRVGKIIMKHPNVPAGHFVLKNKYSSYEHDSFGLSTCPDKEYNSN